MLIIPAIDLMEGRCVRLKQGVQATRKIYADDPAAVAAQWEEEGATWIHVVDLDGAFGRTGANGRAITAILRRTGCAVELGGGIRTLEDIEAWLELGVARVILGTAAVLRPELAGEAVHHFGAGRIVVGVDARGERVAIRGWEEESAWQLADFVAAMETAGVRRIIYTDIARDGEGSGPNLARLEAIARSTGMGIIASGGISRPEHLAALAGLALANIEGAILGTALYEQELILADLIRICQGE
ncbi:MAG TPA: 1-(5-phosphoribosyl)-5-[(5-phosphoribosylamino)methylideneamino]imidazole-4-carboxamide isomerase [bacterium]|nr:1-(5-phosphoribosyl)-5-[(5-phosphoribosylamino)methylideneamino]imidazole-4-carboxamide isomerase [bacterium]